MQTGQEWTMEMTAMIRIAGSYILLQLTALAMLASAQVSHSGAQDGLTSSVDAYRIVLDSVFPAVPTDLRDRSLQYRIVLRFAPSFERESQINIDAKYDGTFVVTVLSVPVSEESIYKQVKSMWDAGVREPSSMAARIHVNKRTISSPSPRLIRNLQELPSLEFSPKLSTVAVLDGTKYDFWFGAASSDLHVSIVAPEAQDDRATPVLVRWMNRVRSAAMASPETVK